MNKVINWVRNHKEAAEDAAGFAAFAAVTVAFFFGSEVLLVVCGVAGVLAIGRTLPLNLLYLPYPEAEF